MASFERFYATEHARVLALVYALTGSWSAAEELTQEAFTRAFTRWSTVGGFARPGAWVRTVAANLARSRGRRWRAERRAHERSADPAVVEDPDPIPRELERFWEAVRGLPRQQQMAVTLHFLEDLPPAEIAPVLGCSASTARVHLHRARGRLQRELDIGVLEEQR